jgi:hypothetical protein
MFIGIVDNDSDHGCAYFEVDCFELSRFWVMWIWLKIEMTDKVKLTRVKWLVLQFDSASYFEFMREDFYLK